MAKRARRRSGLTSKVMRSIVVPRKLSRKKSPNVSSCDGGAGTSGISGRGVLEFVGYLRQWIIYIPNTACVIYLIRSGVLLSSPIHTWDWPLK